MTDQPEMIAAAGRLVRLHAFRGAARVLFNAAVQRQAAEVTDLSQRPAFGRRVKPTEHPAAANDHALPSSEQPGGTVA